MLNDLGSYRDFLEVFQQKGYRFVDFDELANTHGEIVLRHDIDFDTAMAVEAARIEADLGIKATYFFLLRSNFYNVFSEKHYKNIQEIKSLGHTISIHFDPTLYEDFIQGLSMELDFFKSLFKEDIKIISLHRPNEFFLKYNQPIFDVEHTYQAKYFADYKYFADSTGKWRYGHPHDSEEFKEGKSLHVLIHPVWWFIDQASNHDKLRSFYKDRVNLLKEDLCFNCIPFRDIQHEL